MKTTLNLDDALIRKAKVRAVEERTTLTALIERALRELLSPSRRDIVEGYRYAPMVKDTGPRAGVDIADRDRLYDFLEGRD